MEIEDWIYYHPDMHRELTHEEREELDELFWQNEQIPYTENGPDM